jgi:hypothetical protein
MVENLEILFSSSARVQVMRLFLSNPNRRFYQREIERETGQPIRAVQREVQRLTEINLLSRSTEGNRVFYGLDPDFPLLAELTALFQASTAVEKEEGVPECPPALPPEPSTIQQPFAWMQTPEQIPLPKALRSVQVAGEWDRAY